MCNLSSQASFSQQQSANPSGVRLVRIVDIPSGKKQQKPMNTTRNSRKGGAKPKGKKNNQKRKLQKKSFNSQKFLSSGSVLPTPFDYVLLYEDLFTSTRAWQGIPSPKQYPVRHVPFVPMSVRIRQPRDLSPCFTLTKESAMDILETPIPPFVDRRAILNDFNAYLDKIRVSMDETTLEGSPAVSKFTEFIGVKLLNLPINTFYNLFHGKTKEWSYGEMEERRVFNWLQMDWTWRQEFLDLPRIPFRK